METKTIAPSELSKFQATDREQCGILIETKTGIRIAQIKNSDMSPESYAIKMSDLKKLKNKLPVGEFFIGFFHTHLPQHDPRPSDRDFDGATLFPDAINAVYQPSSGSLVWYGGLTNEVEHKT